MIISLCLTLLITLTFLNLKIPYHFHTLHFPLYLHLTRNTKRYFIRFQSLVSEERKVLKGFVDHVKKSRFET